MGCPAWAPGNLENRRRPVKARRESNLSDTRYWVRSHPHKDNSSEHRRMDLERALNRLQNYEGVEVITVLPVSEREVWIVCKETGR